MCVALKHGLVIMSEFVSGGDSVLHMYSLMDGSLVRSIVRKGGGRGKFVWGGGGPCVSPGGDSVLVADTNNDRVYQVRIVDGSWVRFVGEGVLKWPECVDCNTDVIAVLEGCHRISVLSWTDGSVLTRFSKEGSGPGQLRCPSVVRLLADGSSLVVADTLNDRLCVFALSGEFVAAVGSRKQGLSFPYDVLECALDGSFIVANDRGRGVVRLSRDGAKVEPLDGFDEGFDDDAEARELTTRSALARLPEGGLVFRRCLGFDTARIQVFHGLELRKAWITVCVTFAKHGHVGDTAKRARATAV